MKRVIEKLDGGTARRLWVPSSTTFFVRNRADQTQCVTAAELWGQEALDGLRVLSLRRDGEQVWSRLRSMAKLRTPCTFHRLETMHGPFETSQGLSSAVRAEAYSFAETEAMRRAVAPSRGTIPPMDALDVLELLATDQHAQASGSFFVRTAPVTIAAPDGSHALPRLIPVGSAAMQALLRLVASFLAVGFCLTQEGRTSVIFEEDDPECLRALRTDLATLTAGGDFVRHSRMVDSKSSTQRHLRVDSPLLATLMRVACGVGEAQRVPSFVYDTSEVDRMEFLCQYVRMTAPWYERDTSRVPMLPDGALVRSGLGFIMSQLRMHTTWPQEPLWSSGVMRQSITLLANSRPLSYDGEDALLGAEGPNPQLAGGDRVQRRGVGYCLIAENAAAIAHGPTLVFIAGDKMPLHMRPKRRSVSSMTRAR